MTEKEADEAQDWQGMQGSTAWHLIERHAESWEDTGDMMEAWLRANGGGSWDEPEKAASP